MTHSLANVHNMYIFFTTCQLAAVFNWWIFCQIRKRISVGYMQDNRENHCFIDNRSVPNYQVMLSRKKSWKQYFWIVFVTREIYRCWEECSEHDHQLRPPTSRRARSAASRLDPWWRGRCEMSGQLATVTSSFVPSILLAVFMLVLLFMHIMKCDHYYILHYVITYSYFNVDRW